jgi:hypothetical protein
MRSVILTLAIVLGVLFVPVSLAGHSSAAGVAFASAGAPSVQANPQAPQPPAQINVEVNHGGRVWYASPVWVAIGVIALVLVVLLVALAARGGGSGGTTVVRG